MNLKFFTTTTCLFCGAALLTGYVTTHACEPPECRHEYHVAEEGAPSGDHQSAQMIKSMVTVEASASAAARRAFSLGSGTALWWWS
jgi:hypothetical protein